MDPLRIHFIADTDEAGLNFSPNLGIAYLSSYLKRCLPAVETTVSYLFDDTGEHVDRIRPHVIGFSCTSRYFTKFREEAARLRERFDIPMIWGGVHLSIAPRELPECCAAGVVGEGEETLVELLKNFRGGRFENLDSIRGIVFRENGGIRLTEPRPFIESLDDLPYPDVDFLRIRWGRHHRGVMVTSRGCPYRCRFCASAKFWGDRIRFHSAEYVVGNIRRLAERYRVREILIYDDFFTMNRNRIRKISGAVKNDRLLRGMRFECLSRIDGFDERLAQDLKDMGVYRISFGIESGCQRTLDYLKNKTLRLEQVEGTLGIARRHGFECVGSFIIGSPFETEEEIEETLAFIPKLGLDAVQVTIATPFPGTELWEDGKRIGRIRDDAWSDDYYVMYANAPGMSAREQLKGKVLLSQLDRDRFLDLFDKASRIADRINYRPATIAKIAVRSLLADPLGFPKKAVTGLKSLFSGSS